MFGDVGKVGVRVRTWVRVEREVTPSSSTTGSTAVLRYWHGQDMLDGDMNRAKDLSILYLETNDEEGESVG